VKARSWVCDNTVASLKKNATDKSGKMINHILRKRYSVSQLGTKTRGVAGVTQQNRKESTFLCREQQRGEKH